MTGPKVGRNRFRLPFTCQQCGQQLAEVKDPVRAVEELEEHLRIDHGIEVGE